MTPEEKHELMKEYAALVAESDNLMKVRGILLREQADFILTMRIIKRKTNDDAIAKAIDECFDRNNIL